MVNKNSILIMYYRDGESKNFISKKLQISRSVVRKYINEHEKTIKNTDIKDHLEKGLSSNPIYNSSTRDKIKLIKEVEEEIKCCICLLYTSPSPRD